MSLKAELRWQLRFKWMSCSQALQLLLLEAWALTGPVMWPTGSPRVSVAVESETCRALWNGPGQPVQWPVISSYLDSAQSYYSNELNKEDWVCPESENTHKNDQLGPRGELSPHAQNQENKKRDLRENVDTRKLKPVINNILFSDGFCSSAWMFLYTPFCFSRWSEPLFLLSE